MKLPVARTSDLIEQSLGKELLLYDLTVNRAYSLNETLAFVYQHCDGRTTFDQLRQRDSRLNDDVILLALDELGREDLLAQKFDGNGMSRRTLLRKAAVSAVALPVIMAVAAPTAIHAASACNVSCAPEGATCNIANPGACCGGTCVNVGGGVGTCSGGLPPGATCCTNNPGVCQSGTCINAGGGFGTCG